MYCTMHRVVQQAWFKHEVIPAECKGGLATHFKHVRLFRHGLPTVGAQGVEGFPLQLLAFRVELLCSIGEKNDGDMDG